LSRECSFGQASWQRVGSIHKRGRFQCSHNLSHLVPQFVVSHADRLKLFLDELAFSDDRVQMLGPDLDASSQNDCIDILRIS
jgi:hypothetical protein